MSLNDRIRSDVTAAMRSGDALRRDVLRMVQNAIYNAEKRDGRAYSDDELIGILAREVKTRRESVDAFRGGGRIDLAEKEEAEIAVLQEYLPQALDDAALGVLIEEGIAATAATSARDLGKVMGWLAPRIRGRADGKVASGMVAAALAKADLASHDAATSVADPAAGTDVAGRG